MANGKGGCEFGRLNKVYIDAIKSDINAIGKKINRIWWGIVVVGLLVLTNNELASKILEKLIGLK